jgi:hypothetical protein
MHFQTGRSSRLQMGLLQPHLKFQPRLLVWQCQMLYFQKQLLQTERHWLQLLLDLLLGNTHQS